MVQERPLSAGDRMIFPHMLSAHPIAINYGDGLTGTMQYAGGMVSMDVKESMIYCTAWVDRELIGKPVICFGLRTKDLSGKRVKGFPPGQEIVDFVSRFIMSKAQEEGSPIVGFCGTWEKGSDNYNAYLNALRKNVSSHDAALNTWSGKHIAEVLGFTLVRPLEEINLSNPPDKVQILFTADPDLVK